MFNIRVTFDIIILDSNSIQQYMEGIIKVKIQICKVENKQVGTYIVD